MIKVRTFNPRNAVVLATSFIILAASIIYVVWPYQAPYIHQWTVIPPEDIETLTITRDTTLTKDYFNTTIVIAADDITLDGDGHTISGPGKWVGIGDPDIDPDEQPTNKTIGILLEGRTGVTVKNCHVTGFGTGFLLNGSDGNTLQGNTANNNRGGFDLGDSDGNTLEANTATNNRMTGFDLFESHGNSFEANTATNNAFGFMIFESSWNSFEANTANNNEYGFTPTDSADNTFRDNTANSNDEGFWFQFCFGNTLHGNTATNNNQHGFIFDYTNGSILKANTATNNTESGFVFRISSNNTLIGNTASNNDHGMCFRNVPSPNNTIYHNNFVNNILQSHLIENAVNTWDGGYPSGGNYWSDYTGVDANDDGIGDTPYVIDEDNADRFPLMAPISVR